MANEIVGEDRATLGGYNLVVVEFPGFALRPLEGVRSRESLEEAVPPENMLHHDVVAIPWPQVTRQAPGENGEVP